jgi:hypothetical protein
MLDPDWCWSLHEMLATEIPAAAVCSEQHVVACLTGPADIQSRIALIQTH